MQKEEDKKIVIETQLNTQKQELEEARAKTDELADAYQRLKKITSSPVEFRARFGEYGEITSKYGNLQAIERSFNSALTAQDKLEQKVMQTELKYQGINDKVSEYKQKIESVKIQKQVSEVDKLKNSFNQVGSSIQNSISKVARLALGIFGVRSAYMALRRAASDLSNYDSQFAANLEYIRYALTQAIAPVLQWIVNLAAKLLGYINAIMQAWFGINIFANASAKAFNKMKTGAGGVSKAVKQIKKDLAGFDEMNVLQENGNVTPGGGGGGISTPNFDLSGIPTDIPKWLQWIIDHKELILSTLAGIAAIIVGMKIAKLFSNIKGISGLLRTMSSLKIFGMLAGVAVTIVGIVKTVSALIDFIKNPTWSNFGKVLEGLSTILLGVATAMIAFNATNPLGWIVLATGGIAGMVSALIKDRAHILSTKDAQKQLTEAIKATKEATDNYVNAVDNAEQAEKELIEIQKKNKISGEELYKAVQNGTLDYKNMTNEQKEVYKAYLNNKDMQDKLKAATEELKEAKKKETLASLENELALAKEKKQYDELKESVVKAFNEGKISGEEARDILSRAMTDMSTQSRKTFIEELPANIRGGLDPYQYDSVFSKFKRKWNPFMKSLNKEIDILVNIRSSGGGGVGSWGYGGSGGFRAKGGIFYPSKLPKLALGGIINQPGRGVPYNGAIIGERGAEAVVPLTDSQQMALLGETIGRYVNINATVPVYVGNRQIAREIKKINAENDFAFNG